MFDTTFKVNIKDVIAFVTICIPIVGMWFRMAEVERKVDTIYSFYVIEGMKDKNATIPVNQNFAELNAILPKELKGVDVKKGFYSKK